VVFPGNGALFRAAAARWRQSRHHPPSRRTWASTRMRKKSPAAMRGKNKSWEENSVRSCGPFTLWHAPDGCKFVTRDCHVAKIAPIREQSVRAFSLVYRAGCRRRGAGGQGPPMVGAALTPARRSAAHGARSLRIGGRAASPRQRHGLSRMAPASMPGALSSPLRVSRPACKQSGIWPGPMFSCTCGERAGNSNSPGST